MYACMYACMYVCIYVCMHLFMQVCMHVWMYVIYVCVYMFLLMCVCMHVSYVYVYYVCISICMYVFMLVCVCVCMYGNAYHRKQTKRNCRQKGFQYWRSNPHQISAIFVSHLLVSGQCNDTATRQSRLRLLVAAMWPRRPMLHPRPVRVGFIADKVSVWHPSLQIIQFPVISVIPPIFHAQSWPSVYNLRDWGGRPIKQSRK
jgi:hypothetical protein